MTPDEQLRGLEREASAGDPLAVQRLGEERCRRGLHDLPDGLVMWRVSEGRVETFRACRRCGAAVGLPASVTVTFSSRDLSSEDETRDEARVRLRAHVDANAGQVTRAVQADGWVDMEPPRLRRDLAPFVRAGDEPISFRREHRFRVRLIEFRCGRCRFHAATLHIEGEPDPAPPPMHRCR